MKYFGFLAYVLLSGWGVASAAPVQQLGAARVKSVKIYPKGVYVTLSVKASLKGESLERVLFPDLWYADRETVEIRLLQTEQSKGVTFVPEVSPATQNKNVRIYRQRIRQRDVKLEVLGRLRSDSMALEREIDFLKAQTYRSWKSLEEMKSVEKWLKERFPDLYERQRRVKEAIGEQNKLLGEDEQVIASVSQDFSRVTLAWAWVEAPEPREVEFEVSYYADAAEWKPVYFFRFDSKRREVELEYQATIRQWTGFNWNEVETTLGYGMPKRSLHPKQLYRRTVGYTAPAPKVVERSVDILDLDVTQEVAVDVAKFGGTYTGEGGLAATEADVSYRLPKPMSLVYSVAGAQTYQTTVVYKDTVSVDYDYEVTPKISDEVLMIAHIPDWRRLYLMDGRMTIFYDGRMLGKTDLSVNSVNDTLSIPLTVEPLVAVARNEIKNYKRQLSGKREEDMRSYEIRIRNNKEFPVTLTVKDQYPVSNTDEVEVVLTESSGARVDPNTGMLTWKLELAPGVERILKFGYAVRYPKGGTVYF